MTSVHTGYDWLFKEQSEKMSGDIYIVLEHLPPELKQVALHIKQYLYSNLNTFDADIVACRRKIGGS